MAADPSVVTVDVPLCDIEANYRHIRERVDAAIANRDPSKYGAAETPVRLVAVSKTKPAVMIRHLYDVAGCRVFGENYVQELIDKAPSLPQDIEWHFIGHLQSNKALALVRDVPSLDVVETVDSTNLAKKLQNAVAEFRPERPLKVYIQVNTSAEESKSGVAPGDEVLSLAHFIHKECPLLQMCGLMTIGKPSDYTCTVDDFASLRNTRIAVQNAFGGDVTPPPPPQQLLELSMGMSGDFEAAILEGATNVRVGSSIFGPRQKKQ